MIMDPDTEYLSGAAAARLLGLSPSRLHRWRGLGVGPSFTQPQGKHGAVFYEREVVEAWRDAHARDEAGIPFSYDVDLWEEALKQLAPKLDATQAARLHAALP